MGARDRSPLRWLRLPSVLHSQLSRQAPAAIRAQLALIQTSSATSRMAAWTQPLPLPTSWREPAMLPWPAHSSEGAYQTAPAVSSRR